MKKKILLILLTCTIPLSFISCTSESEEFQDKVIRKFSTVDSSHKELQAQVEDLSKQVEILKRAAGVSSDAKYTNKEINFASIRVLAKNAQSKEGEVRVDPNSKFNLSIDIMNSTDENLSQLTCQAYVTYEKNGQFYDRHLVDTRFDVLPKSVRKNIEFKDIPTKSSDITHTLTVIIKDLNGNEVTRFEKKIHIKS